MMAGQVVERSTPHGAISVHLVEDPAALVRLAPEWNALIERTRNAPFYRHEYIHSWIENFNPHAPLKLLAGRAPDGRLVALLPLLEERGALFGVPARLWTSPTNVHSYRFDLLAEDRVAASHAFFDRLRVDRGWDLLRITDVPSDGYAWELYETAVRHGFPAGVYPSNRSTYLSLPASFEALQANLDGKFRRNLRRRRQLLERKGAVSIERFTGGPDLQARLEECFLIEQSGWKGRSGEPANQDRRIHGFYSVLAHRAAQDGSFSLARLNLDGRPIAFHYGLTQDGVYSLIMTSYDEAYRDCSPGHLLVEEVLKLCIQAGLRQFDFLGCDLEWKRAWSSTSRQHSWLFIFRDGYRGRFLRSMKFRVTPAARRFLWWGKSNGAGGAASRSND